MHVSISTLREQYACRERIYFYTVFVYISELHVQAELLAELAKDEKDRENRKAKKKAKKKCKAEGGKGEQVLCGCGAVCDAVTCQRAGQRSSSGSPVRSPSPVRAAPQSRCASRPSDASEGSSDKEKSKGAADPQKSAPKSSPRPSSRSTLGSDLMSPKRPAAKAAPIAAPMSPDGGWETIPASGKGRRSSTGGSHRKPVAMAEPVSHAARGASPEPLPRRQSLGSCQRPGQPQPPPPPPASTANGRQPVVRAIPVTATHHAHAAAQVRAAPLVRTQYEEKGHALVSSPAAGGHTSAPATPVAVKPAPPGLLSSEGPALTPAKQSQMVSCHIAIDQMCCCHLKKAHLMAVLGQGKLARSTRTCHGMP